MKNIFRLALLSVISISLLTSCSKLGYNKHCNSECNKAKVEDTKTPSTTQVQEATPVKKTKKAKKAKKIEAVAPAVAPAVENKTN
jgi:hypothetical protein